MKILISAAETSSDIHGAQLLRALKKQLGERQVEAIGIGGPELRAEGLRVIVDARRLLAMGFTEILGRLPEIFRALKKIARAAETERPDLAVVIDYPDFHFRLAKRLNRVGVPVIYYIPPKVWAWRAGRVKVLRERFVQVLSVLPFEVDFYRREQVPVKYVGNPLVDELPLTLTRPDARRKLRLRESDKVLLVMPGSRPAELKNHLKLMLEAARLTALGLRKRNLLGSGERMAVLIPFPPMAEFSSAASRIEDWISENAYTRSLLDLRVSQGDAHLGMVAADAGVIKSGTSTLEAGILGCPHLLLYRADWLSHFIFEKIVRRKYKGPVGLVNLVYGWEADKPLLVREFVERDMAAAPVAEEAISLIADAEKRARIEEGLKILRRKLLGDSGGAGPSEAAAREITRIFAERSAKGPSA